MGVVVLDAFEYIAVPGMEKHRGKVHTALETATGVDILSQEEIEELQKKIDAAKKAVAEKTEEVEKIVEKVEEEVKKEEAEAKGEDPAKVETPEEKKEEEKKKEAVVEAVVEKELGIDRFCGNCQYKQMPFNCNKRLSWMMESYGLSEEVAKESIINTCHTRLRRGRVLKQEYDEIAVDVNRVVEYMHKYKDVGYV